jgi:hypothetical protein
MLRSLKLPKGFSCGFLTDTAIQDCVCLELPNLKLPNFKTTQWIFMRVFLTDTVIQEEGLCV